MPGKRRAGRDPVAMPPSSAERPTAQSVIAAPRTTRREVRQQRQQRRRRFGAAGIAVAVLIAAIVVGGIVFGVHHAITDKKSSGRTQTTALLQVTGSDGKAIGTVLLAHDSSSGQGLQVLVPATLSTDVCGFGQQQFGSILGLPDGASESRTTLTGLLSGVKIDGSWILSTSQLAKLVDGVGGVDVNVDTNVLRRTKGGGGDILVPKGQHALTGTQAAQYATYIASTHEDASAMLSRFQQVMDGAIQKLPTTSTSVQAELKQLGSGGTSTLGASKLADLLIGVAADDQKTGAVLPTDLPVKPIDAGGAPTYSLDESATNKLVDANLKASLPSGKRQSLPKVHIENGIGTPGLVPSACAKLIAAGFQPAGSGNAPSFSNGPSRVDIFSDSDAAIALGQKAAKALKLPASDVLRSNQNQDIADVFVILGKDYKR